MDGHEYVDYFGATVRYFLGHGNPEVLAAVHETLDQGKPLSVPVTDTNLGWANVFSATCSNADRLRFTASGTEATHLGLRLARAFTGPNKNNSIPL
ncbi:MAG: hypothetical protein Ct9H300mP14_14560 [Gammaproteobacteria bacterium]|nr:MAG: hypothetical protein Ct9H300mP14_14560 [Gammaproteobacteria bacterium]